MRIDIDFVCVGGMTLAGVLIAYRFFAGLLYRAWTRMEGPWGTNGKKGV